MVGTYYLMVVNALTIVLYAQDKIVSKGWLPFLGRVPEGLLHQLELFGGSPGAFIAQRLFWHKISKKPFQHTFSNIITIQMAAGLAWGYFRGASWILAGLEIIAALMLVKTRLQLRRRDDLQRGPRQSKPRQKPVSAAAATSQRQARQDTGIAPSWRGYGQ